MLFETTREGVAQWFRVADLQPRAVRARFAELVPGIDVKTAQGSHHRRDPLSQHSFQPDLKIGQNIQDNAVACRTDSSRAVPRNSRLNPAESS